MATLETSPEANCDRQTGRQAGRMTKPRTVKGTRNHFRGMFDNVDCPLGCGNIDTIQNVLNNNMSCNSITESKVKYKDIFSESK